MSKIKFFEGEQKGRIQVGDIPQPDETTRLYAFDRASEDFVEALSHYIADVDAMRETNFTASTMVSAENRFTQRCIEIAQKVIDCKEPENDYIHIEKNNTEEFYNPMTIDMGNNCIYFRAARRPDILSSVIRRDSFSLNGVEKYRFDPAVTIRIAKFTGYEIILANQKFSVRYMNRDGDGLPLETRINTSTEILTPGIFEISQPVDSDRIEAGTIIARMYLSGWDTRYSKDSE